MSEESVLASGKELSIRYGSGLVAPVGDNGYFQIEGCVESAAMLSAVDSFGDIALMSVYPKSDLLPQQPARLDYMTSAVALVFARPGFATPNPVAAAAITKYIEQIPETSQLASLLQEKAKTNPTILENPDEEILMLAADICTTIVEDAEKAGSGSLGLPVPGSSPTGCGNIYASPHITAGTARESIWDEPSGDTRNDCFADVDGQEGDGIDMIASYTGKSGAADFTGVNHYMRWVAVYCDPLDDGANPLLPEDSLDMVTPAAMLEPRNFSLLPTLSDLLKYLLVYNYKDVLRKMLAEGELPQGCTNPEDYGMELWEALLAGLIENYLPTEGEFSLKVEENTDYLVSTHGPGTARGNEGGPRDHIPTLYTCITELCLPLIGLFMDMPDIDPALRETPSLMGLARKFEWQLQELIGQTQSGHDQAAAVEAWNLFISELMQDPDFFNLMCAAYEITADSLSNIVAIILGQAFPAIGTYHKIAGGLNLCAGTLGVVLAVQQCSMIDNYYLSPRGGISALMQNAAEQEPQETRVPLSGPVEALKGFFGALAVGDTAAASSCVYTTSYGMSFITWGAIGFYNLIGNTAFSGMTYQEVANDGISAKVHTTGSMDYGDHLGLVVNTYRIDGYAELMIQNGAWKVVSLPAYTLVGVRSEMPEDFELPENFELPDDMDLPDNLELPYELEG